MLAAGRAFNLAAVKTPWYRDDLSREGGRGERFGRERKGLEEHSIPVVAKSHRKGSMMPGKLGVG